MAETLTRKLIVDRILNKYPNMQRFHAKEAVTAVVDEIASSIKQGDPVQLRGLGAFVGGHRKAHMAKNPATGAEVPQAARRTVRFRPGKDISEHLKQPVVGQPTVKV